MMRKRLLIVFGLIIGSAAMIFSTGALVNSDMSGISMGESDSTSMKTVDDRDNGLTENCALSQSYPPEVQQWCGLIMDHANQHAIDPNLIAALILQESGGNAAAYSKSGAVGLMQEMPRDGLAAEFMCPNGPCFANRPSMDELFDPTFNIEYGTRFLAGLINRQGNIRDALKAYGPANVGYYYADIVLAIYDRY